MGPGPLGENLIKTSKISHVKEVLGEEAVRKSANIPLSNNTITRRQYDLVADIEEQLIILLRSRKNPLQLDEITLHDQTIVLRYMRFFNDKYIIEEILFIKILPVDTNSEPLFNESVNSFKEAEIRCQKILDVASDGTGDIWQI